MIPTPPAKGSRHPAATAPTWPIAHPVANAAAFAHAVAFGATP